MHLIRCLIFVLFFFVSRSCAWATTPCLEGWQYSRKITLHNTGDPMNRSAIRVSDFNSLSLISAQKMKVCGGDVRILDANGKLLNCWIVPESLGTTNTVLWVDVRNLPVGSSPVYLFYGNPGALTVSDPHATFAYFEDFSAGELGADWHGDRSQAGIAHGTLRIEGTLASTSKLYLMREMQENLGMEAKVSVSVPQEGASYTAGILQKEKQGYALRYTCSTEPVAHILSCALSVDDALDCELISGQAQAPDKPAGDWYVNWSENRQHALLRGTQLAMRTDDTQHDRSFGTVPLFAVEGASTLLIERFFLFSPGTESVSTHIGEEQTMPLTSDMQLTHNLPVCEGDTAWMHVVPQGDLSYRWLLPDGTFVSGHSLVLPDAKAHQSGTYVLQVSGADICRIVKPLEVEISPPTKSGYIAGFDSVCRGDAALLALQEAVGDVMRWETSATGSAPWFTVQNEWPELELENVQESRYYKAIVQSGVCKAKATAAYRLRVDNPPVPGYIQGDGFVCAGNELSLFLSEHFGQVEGWLYRYRDSNTWHALAVPEDALVWLPQQAGQVRVSLRSGACGSMLTSPFDFTLSAPPLPGTLLTDTVCEGENQPVLRTSGHRGRIVRWERSGTEVLSWEPVWRTDSTLSLQHVQADRYWRVALSTPGCDTVFSEAAHLVVERKPSAGRLLAPQDLCAKDSATLVLQAFAGEFSRFLSSSDGVAWKQETSVIPELGVMGSGDTLYYKALVQSKYSACTPDTATALIAVSTPPSGGYPNHTSWYVCEEGNEGRIRYKDYTGHPKRWETAGHKAGPWETISNKSDSLRFRNITSSRWFRMVTATPECPDAAAIPVHVQVDKESLAGFIQGSAEVCAGNNEGELTLLQHRGTIQAWEQNVRDGGWEKILHQQPVYLYNALEESVDYRVIVQQGACPPDTTPVANLLVHPTPKASFSVDEVFLHRESIFHNTSHIVDSSRLYSFWDFGDGRVSHEKHPVHQYRKAGTYLAFFNTRSVHGCVDTLVQSVRVFAVPLLDMHVDEVCAGEELRLINQTLHDEPVFVRWRVEDTLVEGHDTLLLSYAVAGEYTACMEVFTKEGYRDSLCRTFQVYPNPSPDFGTADRCADAPYDLALQLDGDYGNTTMRWFVDDSLHATTELLSLPLQLPGTYRLKIEVETDKGCLGIKEKPYTVYPVPQADFQAVDVPYLDTAYFTSTSLLVGDTLTYFHWKLGDGGAHAGEMLQHTTHLYKRPGQYAVVLSVNSDKGCSASLTKMLEVYPLPNVDFQVQHGCVGDTFSFYNRSSIAHGNMRYEWHFGDGERSEEAEPKHVYELTGTYVVQLVVRGEGMASDTMRRELLVYSQPMPEFYVDKVCYGDRSQFHYVPVDAAEGQHTFHWDFGDGSGSSLRHPGKLYLNPGRYTVSLQVQNRHGCTALATGEAEVLNLPLTNFSVTHHCLGKPLRLLDDSQHERMFDYTWLMGDGSVYHDKYPRHTYGQTGHYPVRLRIEDEYGCVDSLLREVEVYALPAVQVPSDFSLRKGTAARIYAEGGVSYEWSPGEGLDYPGAQNPLARPMESTRYRVWVRDTKGCEDTASVYITVEDDKYLIPSNVLTPDGNGKNDTWYVEHADIYEDIEVKIFNRYGVLLYEEAPYRNDWDGRNRNGDLLPDGTYYYLISFSGDDRVYKGSITLFRNR